MEAGDILDGDDVVSLGNPVVSLVVAGDWVVPLVEICSVPLDGSGVVVTTNTTRLGRATGGITLPSSGDCGSLGTSSDTLLAYKDGTSSKANLMQKLGG